MISQILNSGIALAQEAGAAPKGPSTLELLIMPLGFILIIYFFIIVPQKRKAKEHQNLLNSLKPGDEVVTTGGIIGKVKSISDIFVSVDIAPNTTIKILKPHIVTYTKPKDPKAAAVAPVKTNT